MMRLPLPALALGAMLAACSTVDRPDASNLAAYCTPENGYRLGYQSKAYFGGCPNEAEGAFLAALQRGRGYRYQPPQVMPYYERMEQTERQIRAASSNEERARLRTQLAEIEWWAIHIVTSPGTYSQGGGDR